jgi:hypothetical protein
MTENNKGMKLILEDPSEITSNHKLFEWRDK